MSVRWGLIMKRAAILAFLVGCTSAHYDAAPDAVSAGHDAATSAPTGPTRAWGHATDGGALVDLQLWPGPIDYQGRRDGECFVARVHDRPSLCLPPQVLQALVEQEADREQATRGPQ